MPLLDILIPTYNRPAALAVLLASLCAQTCKFRVVISDQTEESDAVETGEVQAVMRLLLAKGQTIATHKHLPRLGLAEHRQFLLDQATAPYVLFLDDDLILEADVVQRLLTAIQEENCGFVGSAAIGLSFINDVRLHQQAIEFWEEPVQPEVVRSNTPAWERYRLHNAANLYHVEQRLGIRAEHPRKYKVAWVAGCILYDAEKLRSVGGFSFWKELPTNHCGEDVLAQLRVMSRYGGCGLLPSGVYHQELPTTVPDRHLDAPQLLPL